MECKDLKVCALCGLLLGFNSDIVECKDRGDANTIAIEIRFNSDIVECKEQDTRVDGMRYEYVLIAT